jgi:hypothetical protein
LLSVSESSESDIQPLLKYDQNGNLERENAIRQGEEIQKAPNECLGMPLTSPLTENHFLQRKYKHKGVTFEKFTSDFIMVK